MILRLISLILASLFLGCSHYDLKKTITKHKPQIYEGTLSCGAPFILFIKTDNKTSMEADIPSELSDYISRQPEHPDPSSDSGFAQSIHVVFKGQVSSLNDELGQPQQDKIRIIRVIRCEPVHSDYIQSITKN